MYEQTFKFSSRPFNNVPCAEYFFAASSHQQALDLSSMCVDRSTGPVALIGPVGMGKSLMLQMLSAKFEGRFDVVNIECSRLVERCELLQSILFELDLPYTGLSEGELRMTLMGFLKKKEPTNEGVLLLVDEADRLSVELIDELRMISNQIRNGRSIVQIVLAGTQRLDESLNDPKLASFNQRIAARCLLQELSKSEVRSYIEHHIERVGRKAEDVFSDYAIDEIWTNTDGCPRLLNQLCDQALIIAASRGKEPIDRELIREAWSEMQNLPGAYKPPTSIETFHASEAGGEEEAAECNVVEFGQLDEAPSSLNQDAGLGLSADPFAPQTSADEVPEQETLSASFEVGADVPTDSTPERIASLEQEQDELMLQTGRFQEDEAFGQAEPEASDEGVDDRAQGVAAIFASLEMDEGSEEEPSQNSDPQNVGNPSDEDGSLGEEADLRIQEQLGLIEREPEELDAYERPGTQDGLLGQTAIFEQGITQGADVAEQPVAEAAETFADPFAEQFEEEELLEDAYSPFVAKQNRASLDVTSSALNYLTPIDEDSTEQIQLSGALQPSFSVTQDDAHDQAIEDEELAELTAIDTDLESLTGGLGADAELDLYAADLSDLSETHTEQDAESSPYDGLVDLDEIIPASLLKSKEGNSDTRADLYGLYRDNRAQDESPEVNAPIDASEAPLSADDERRRETEAFMQTFQDQVKASFSDETDSDSAANPDAVGNDAIADVDDPSQEILREIFAQQQIISDVHYTQDQQVSDAEQSLAQESSEIEEDTSDRDVSFSVDYPVTEHESYQVDSDQELARADDRDLLYVNKSQEYERPAQADELSDADSFSSGETSIGNAKRMDYGQLFEQLRNLPKE